jgi:hypothetical protein
VNAEQYDTIAAAVAEVRTERDRSERLAAGETLAPEDYDAIAAAVRGGR